MKFTALRSQQSVKYAVFFISSLFKFDRFSAISWASPRNCTCKMLMRWSAHLPKGGVTERVKDTSWFYWLISTLITFFFLFTILVTMFINVCFPIYFSWNLTLSRPFCFTRAYKRRPWRPYFSLFSNSKDLDLCFLCNLWRKWDRYVNLFFYFTKV